MQNYKKRYKITYLQNRNTFTDLKNKTYCNKGEGWRERMDWEFGTDM